MIEPAKVELKPEGIAIEWRDNHKSFYPSKYLRINCACAGCIEEWTKRKLLDPVTVPSDIQAVDYMEVGRYALQFLWSDAHYTGIYPYDTLRALCPCSECEASRSKIG